MRQTALHALHFMQPAPSSLVFFLHGNGGDLSTWTTGTGFHRRVNYDLFIVDYRGYGLSTGRIESEAQLHAARAYPLVPRFVLKYPLRTDTVIGEVKSPILLVGGTHDDIIPIEDSLQLMRLAKSPIELLRIEGAGHNNIHEFPTYLDGLATRLNQVAGH